MGWIMSNRIPTSVEIANALKCIYGGMKEVEECLVCSYFKMEVKSKEMSDDGLRLNVVGYCESDRALSDAINALMTDNFDQIRNGIHPV